MFSSGEKGRKNKCLKPYWLLIPDYVVRSHCRAEIFACSSLRHVFFIISHLHGSTVKRLRGSTDKMRRLRGSTLNYMSPKAFLYNEEDENG
jgi:hypothetical protein